MTLKQMKALNIAYFFLLALFLLLLFANWEDVFGQSPNWTGVGTKADPYVITTPQGLEDLQSNTYYAIDGNVYFALGADIDMTGRGDWSTVDGSGGQYWENHLDGRHHRIIGLDLDYSLSIASGNMVKGMFYGIGWNVTAADTTNPIIKNLIFDGTLVGGTRDGGGIGEQYFGILSGYISLVRQSYWGGSNEPIAHPAIDSLVIENSVYSSLMVQQFNRQSTGSVSGYAVGGTYSRIIVRDTMNVSSQTITQDITSDDNSDQIGGIFGLLYSDGRLLKCAFEGEINFTEHGGTSVGGLVGKVWSNVEFYDSYFNGSINITENSTYTAVGGIFGARKGTSTGLVNIPLLHGVYVACDMPNEVHASDAYGLVYGYCGSNVLAENTYTDNSFTNTNNYGNTLASPPFDASGMADGSISKTTTQMQTQSTFEASEGYPFDFTNTWAIKASEYPYLQWTAPTSSITIKTPSNGSYQTIPFTVAWTGVGNYDTVTVNGVNVDDSSYTFTTGTAGNFPIAVKLRSDSAVMDSIAVTLVDSNSIKIDTAYIVGNSIKIRTLQQDIDSINFYVGLNPSSLTFLGKVLSPVFDSTYTLSLNDYYGSGTTYVKAETAADTTKAINTVNFTSAQIPYNKGSAICYYLGWSFPYEPEVEWDAGCRWVNNITLKFYVPKLLVDAGNDGLYWSSGDENVCPAPHDDPFVCGFSYNVHPEVTLYDTTTSTSDTTKTAFLTVYNLSGANVVSGSRYYYMNGGTVYSNDLVNNIDSQLVTNLNSYVSDLGSNLTLYLYKYKMLTWGDTIRYDGNLATIGNTMEQVTTHKLVVKDLDNHRVYWHDVLTTPINKTYVSDTYSIYMAVTNTKNYFRGIHPRILKNGTL